MNNMEFYICKRFMTIDFPKYLEEMGWQKEEIVSVNCALFPFVERKEYLSKTNLTRNEQILAVMLVEKDAVLPMLAGYEFCGFDLAEEGGISALTNCLHDFDEVFAFQNLNMGFWIVVKKLNVCKHYYLNNIPINNTLTV